MSRRRPSALALVLALLVSGVARAQVGAKGGDGADGADEAARDEAVLSTAPTEAPPKKPGLAYYEELAKKQPDDPDAHQALAAAHMRRGNVDEARRHARRAIDLAPSSPETHQALGLIEEGAGNLAAAETELKKAASLDGNVEYRLDVARVLFRQGRLAEAEEEWAKITKDFDKNLEVQFALADAARELGRTDAAAAAYDRALALAAPGIDRRIDILVEHARMLADQGRTAQAYDLLVRAKAEGPGDADVHYNLGVLAMRRGQPTAAITAFQQAITLRPDHARAHNNVGVAFDKLRRFDEAAAAFMKAVDVDPRFADALYNLGLVLFKQHKLKEAGAAFERALGVAPDMGDAKFYLGEVYFQLGDRKKALRVYKDALRTNPEDGASHRRLGDLYLAGGDVDLAVGEYWAAVDVDDKDADNRAQLMRVLLVRNGDGDVRRALKLGEAGLARDPKAFAVRLALAEAEVQQGRTPRARQLLEAGVAVAPDDPAAHVALGRHFLDQGNVAQAGASFDVALAKDPKNAAALASLGSLHYARGDRALAKQYFQRALAVDGTLASARADLGRLLYEDDRNPEALKELKRATEDAPALGKAWFYLAFAQNKAGQGVAAVETSLKKAITNQPDLAEAHVQLGKIYEAQKRTAEACKSYLAALTHRPSYEEARLASELLSCSP